MAGTPNFGIPKPVETDNIDQEMRRLQAAWDLVDLLFKNLTDLIGTKAAAAHTHTMDQINGLMTALNSKMASSRTFTLAELTDVVGAIDAATGYILQKNAEGKFIFSSPAAVLGNHQHAIADIVGLRDELDGILASVSGLQRSVRLNRDQFRSVPVITATNLLIRSGELANASWVATNLTKVAAAAIAPDGTTTAAKITETAVNSSHALTLNGQALTAGQPFTQSIFVKAAERTKFRLNLQTNIGAVGTADFDVSSGTLIAKSAGITATEIEDWSNGWFRISASGLAQTGATVSTAGKFFILNASGVISYLGVVNQGLFVWGAQLENGVSKMGPYVPTTTAAATGELYSNRHLAEELAVTNTNVTNLTNTVAANQTAALAAIDPVTSMVGVLSLEVADLKGTRIGMTASVADAFDDTTGVALNTGGLDENTLLLISANGANAATAFTDSSAYGRRVTPSGDAKISTAQSKFGGSSAAFDGAGDYLTVPYSRDFDFGTGDFTFDTWVRFANVAGNQQLIDARNSAGQTAVLYLGGAKINYLVNGVSTLVGTTTLVVNTWYHVAVVRLNGTVSLYINGILESTASDTSSYVSNGLTIGTDKDKSSNPLNGFLDEIRVSNVARWTGNFTPPTVGYAQTATESLNTSYDPVNDYFRGSLTDPNTKVLLHFDGANGSRTIVDETGRPWSAFGDAQISTAQSKFGGASAAFDGTGDGLFSPNFSDLAFGLGDFTIETWVRFNTVAVAQNFVEFRTNSNQATPTIYMRSSKIAFYVGNTDILASTTTIVVNTWYHVAWVRINGTTKLYVNGVEEGSIADANVYQCTQLVLGIDAGRAGNGLNGYLDEVRISQNARYTANFTPATVAFPYTRNNLTLLSQAYAAAAVPTTGRLVVQTLEADTITINTDLIGELSRDGGTTWTAAALALSSNINGVKLYEGQVSLTGQPSGSSMRFRTRTLNNKNVAISGVVAQWRS